MGFARVPHGSERPRTDGYNGRSASVLRRAGFREARCETGQQVTLLSPACRVVESELPTDLKDFDDATVFTGHRPDVAISWRCQARRLSHADTLRQRVRQQLSNR